MVYVAQPTNPLSIFTDSIDKTCVSDGRIAFVLGGTHQHTHIYGHSMDKLLLQVNKLTKHNL